jgi:hypothetical protein
LITNQTLRSRRDTPHLGAPPEARAAVDEVLRQAAERQLARRRARTHKDGPAALGAAEDRPASEVPPDDSPDDGPPTEQNGEPAHLWPAEQLVDPPESHEDAPATASDAELADAELADEGTAPTGGPGEASFEEVTAVAAPLPAPADQSGAFAEATPFLADRAFPELPRAPRATAKAAPRPHVKVPKLNPWLFRGAIFAPIAAAAAAGYFATVLSDPRAPIAVGVGMLVMSAAAQLILIYRIWSAVQDSHAPFSAAKASLLLLIPLFNMYWLFRALPGYATVYNAFTARYLLRVPRLSQNLILAAMVVPVAGLGFYWIVVRKLCDAVNAIPAGPRSPASMRGDSVADDSVPDGAM